MMVNWQMILFILPKKSKRIHSQGKGKPSDSSLKKLTSGVVIDKKEISFTDLVRGKETSSYMVCFGNFCLAKIDL